MELVIKPFCFVFDQLALGLEQNKCVGIYTSDVIGNDQTSS